jgi:hypothetical protein
LGAGEAARGSHTAEVGQSRATYSCRNPARGTPICAAVDERGQSMNAYTFGKFYIPERMMGGIERWIQHGIPPGDFLMAVIENDLKGAVACADDENLPNLPAYVSYFYNKAPSPCWGSPEKAAAWIERFNERRAAEAGDDRR